MATPEAELLEAAARLARAAGCAPPVALAPLEGGRNNRVFRVGLADGDSVVLKSYFPDPRDRLGAEWAFLTRARDRGVHSAPLPLARDVEARLGLYSFLDGVKLAPATVSAEHVRDAAGFVVALNAAPRELAAVPVGAEACFSLAQHLGVIERRVRRLERRVGGAPHASAARALLAERLRPTWTAVKAHILRAVRDAGTTLAEPFPDEELIVSPSDFGFHNALWDEAQGLRFIDFEHAGRDDPAKLAGDFFSCPEIPAPIAGFDAFVSALVEGLGLGRRVRARCRLLLDAYRVKWACIILNDFLPAPGARRAFALGGDRRARRLLQLEKAEAKLDEIVL